MSWWFDLDGTITVAGGYGLSRVKIPWRAQWVLFKVYKPKTRWTVSFMRSLHLNGEDVNIVTARSEELEEITRAYLKARNVPYNKIFFVGPGEGSEDRKIKKIKQQKGKFLFDNDKRVVNLAKEKGVFAYLV